MSKKKHWLSKLVEVIVTFVLGLPLGVVILGCWLGFASGIVRIWNTNLTYLIMFVITFFVVTPASGIPTFVIGRRLMKSHG